PVVGSPPAISKTIARAHSPAIAPSGTDSRRAEASESTDVSLARAEMAFTPEAKCESWRKSANIAWIGIDPPSETSDVLGLGPITTVCKLIVGESLLVHAGITSIRLAINPLLSISEVFCERNVAVLPATSK